MAQREAVLSRKIMTALRADGIFCFKVHGSAHMMSGLPDIIACPGGAFVGLETKHEETRSHTSNRQEYVHGLIEESGGYAVVVTSVAEARAACRAAVQELQKRKKI